MFDNFIPDDDISEGELLPHVADVEFTNRLGWAVETYRVVFQMLVNGISTTNPSYSVDDLMRYELAPLLSAISQTITVKTESYDIQNRFDLLYRHMYCITNYYYYVNINGEFTAVAHPLGTHNNVYITSEVLDAFTGEADELLGLLTVYRDDILNRE